MTHGAPSGVGSPPTHVAFFDLDRTLLDINSGSLWLRTEWQAGRVRSITMLHGLAWLAWYGLGGTELESALQRAASLYAGVAEADMAERVDRWFDAQVAPHIRPGALRALQDHRHAGHAVVLATSSSHFAAASATRTWPFDDAIATELEVTDDRLTGRILAMGFGSHKRDRCLAWADARGVHPDNVSFYTDSFSDLPLLEQVGRPVVVDPDRRLAAEARRRGWMLADWGTSSP